MQAQITTGAQTVTAAGPVSGTLDTSGIAGDFTIELVILGVSPATTARIAIEDGTTFTGLMPETMPLAIFHIEGPVMHDGNVQQSARKYEVCDVRAGTAGTALRVNVISLTPQPGIAPSLTVDATLTY